MDDSPWDAHHRAVLLHIANDNRSCADPGVGTHSDRAKNFGACTNNNIFGQGWVTFAVIFARASKGDSLIKQTAITHLRCFTDHHPHAVVNEDASADAGTWVDLNTSQPSAKLA